MTCGFASVYADLYMNRVLLRVGLLKVAVLICTLYNLFQMKYLETWDQGYI